MYAKQELTKGIYFVGAIDWNIKDFHGYTTPRGVTYNSYLIVDEKICLIDLVKAPFANELIERVSAIVDPAKIDYVIINHVENDHASALPELAKVAVNAQYIITDKGKDEAEKLYGDYNYKTVKVGDSINLGSNTLNFVPVPMLHWPDSMVCYCPEQGILFSNDAFGQHICTTKRFDYEVDVNAVMYEAKKYFANILFPYAKLIPGALKTLGSLDIKYIFPSHGICWKENVPDILTKYAQWGAAYKKPHVLIMYETMWGATEAMAKVMLEGVKRAGVAGSLYRLSLSERSHVAAEILEAGGLLFGSSTLNYGMLPVMAENLYYLKGLKPGPKLSAAFGAYGWSGGSQKEMEELMVKAGLKVEPGITVAWKSSPEELAQCEQFAYEFALKVKEETSK